MTAPEPSQIHAAEAQIQYSKHDSKPRSSSGTLKKKGSGDRAPRSPSSSGKASHNNPYTPPPSASPTASSFHPSNPFSDQYSPTTPTRARAPRIAVDRTPSGSSDSSTGSVSGNTRPPSYKTADRHPRPRSSSARNPQDPAGSHHRSSSTAAAHNSHRQILGQNLPQRSASNGHQHQRNASLPQRFPGDMSHRPLDMIKRETKAADRHPHVRSSHRRHRSAASQTDTIDALDTVGGTYHHGGPYDATLASRNLNEKYSPLAAVRDSNMEAIRATPREFIDDSLRKHVPLQGTATVPSGAHDFSGKLMEYTEGADLMREPDAAGGAYKRWEGMVSSPCVFQHSNVSLTLNSNITLMILRARANPPSPSSATPRR